MSATQHVIIALSLAAIVYIVAGDKWGVGVAAVRPVKPATRKAN